MIKRPAPKFSLLSTAGGELSLADFRGQKIVLYFYPNDDTPTCARQACLFRDAYADLQRAGAVLLGVSTDSLQSHEKFRRKHQLPFILLSDPDHTVASAYGVWKRKKLFGHTYMGIERSTFIIDTAGKISQIFRNVRLNGHIPKILAALAKAS